MSRTSLALASFLVLWLLLPARAANPGAWGLDVAKMKVALHTATAEEGGFIEHVVDLVQRDRLPVSLVQSTFLWARKKPLYKFQYFRMGLILRAQWLGIELYP